jgi:glycosyltransferase involved in cell wall biosynthesis
VRVLPTRVPIVWVMHSGINDFANKALRFAERELSGRAEAVIAAAQKNIDDYVAEIRSHPSMILAPNDVGISRFAHRAEPTPSAIPSKSRRQIVQIGRYVPEKNQLQTVHAFARVATADSDVSSLLCGLIENLDYHAAIVSLVGELGLADRVEIAGPQGNVPEILWESHAFAMPSSCEAHSVGFLEALASGIPVVANTIDSFAFANTLPGVRLVDTSDADGYGRALLAALATPRAARTAGHSRALSRHCARCAGTASALRRSGALVSQPPYPRPRPFKSATFP